MATYQQLSEPIIDRIDGEFYAYEIVVGKQGRYVHVPITESEMHSFKRLFRPIEEMLMSRCQNEKK